MLIAKKLGRHDFCRFHAIGEMYNDKHMENIVAICNNISHVTFTLWTKRSNIVNRVLHKTGKPGNLRLIYSSPLLNKSARLSSSGLKKYFNQVFTVFAPEFIESNNVSINCGSKKCNECRLCYGKAEKFVPYINEKLK
jgi:hypothetical protein